MSANLETESTPTKKRQRRVSFAANLTTSAPPPPTDPTPEEAEDHVHEATHSVSDHESNNLHLSERQRAWLAQLHALDVAVCHFQSRQQLTLFDKLALWVQNSTKRSFTLQQLSEILALAPNFFTVSLRVGESSSALVVSANTTSLESQLQARRNEFRDILQRMPSDSAVSPVDVIGLAHRSSVASPIAGKSVLGTMSSPNIVPVPSPDRRKRAATSDADDQKPSPKVVAAQRRIDALLGHPETAARIAEQDQIQSPEGGDASLQTHIALAQQRGRELEELAVRHRARQPLLRAADEAIDILRSHFSIAKRASLPLENVVAALQVGLQLSTTQAGAVLDHLATGVPDWLTKASFGKEVFISLKPLSKMSTALAHELFADWMQQQQQQTA